MRIDDESENEFAQLIADDEDRRSSPPTTSIFDDTGDEIDLDFQSQPPRCGFITGSAGTGKTYQLRELIRNDPSEGMLCATTGIAGVNLGTVTINSQLRYFDTDSMINGFVSGRLV